MIKKIILTILFISIIVAGSGQTFAVSPTPSSSLSPSPKATATPASTTPKDSQIEKIKDLVASRVAELKLVEKRGIVGYVKSKSNTQIIVNNSHGQESKIDIDELTKFSSPNVKDTFGISDIEKGDLLSLIGLYNKQTKRLLARFVEISSNIPQNIEGVVIAKDAASFTIDIALGDGIKNTVNIESSTKTSSYEEGEMVKSGFTKIETGERVIVVGFEDKNDASQINSSRIIRFPGVELSTQLKKAAAASVTDTTPSPKP